MLSSALFTHRQLDDFVEEDVAVGKEVEHKVLMGRRDRGHLDTWFKGLIDPRQAREPSYLVVKRSVGSLLDGRLFFLVTNLDHDTGVDVLTHQLPGLGDVDGDLQEQNNKRDASHATAQMKESLSGFGHNTYL